jgi:hypothetical protein
MENLRWLVLRVNEFGVRRPVAALQRGRVMEIEPLAKILL